MQEEMNRVKGGWGVAMAHMDFSPVFCTLHSIALILFFLSFSLPPSLPHLALSLSLSLVFLALAGHAAAAELFGSLGFMFAALQLPLMTDSLTQTCTGGDLCTIRPLQPRPSKTFLPP